MNRKRTHTRTPSSDSDTNSLSARKPRKLRKTYLAATLQETMQLSTEHKSGSDADVDSDFDCSMDVLPANTSSAPVPSTTASNAMILHSDSPACSFVLENTARRNEHGQLFKPIDLYLNLSSLLQSSEISVSQVANIKQLPRGGWIVRMRSSESACALVALLRSFDSELILNTPCSSLQIFHGKTRSKPSVDTTRCFVVKPVPKDLSESDLRNLLFAQNELVAELKPSVFLFTKPDQTSCGAVKLSFAEPPQAERVFALGHLKIGNFRAPLAKFNLRDQRKPVIRCFKCHKIGHVADICRSAKVVCGRCGFKNTDKDTHNWNNCENDSHCNNCGESHPTWSSQCKAVRRGKQSRKRVSVANPTSVQKATSRKLPNSRPTANSISISHDVGNSVPAPVAPRDVLASQQQRVAEPKRKTRRNRRNRRNPARRPIGVDQNNVTDTESVDEMELDQAQVTNSESKSITNVRFSFVEFLPIISDLFSRIQRDPSNAFSIVLNSLIEHSALIQRALSSLMTATPSAAESRAEPRARRS